MEKPWMTPKRRASIERRKKRGDFARAGRKGGEVTKQRMLAKDPNYFNKISRQATEALLAKYGPDHFSRIGSIKKGEGKKGAQS